MYILYFHFPICTTLPTVPAVKMLNEFRIYNLMAGLTTRLEISNETALHIIIIERAPTLFCSISCACPLSTSNLSWRQAIWSSFKQGAGFIMAKSSSCKFDVWCGTSIICKEKIFSFIISKHQKTACLSACQPLYEVKLFCESCNWVMAQSVFLFLWCSWCGTCCLSRFWSCFFCFLQKGKKLLSYAN